MKLMSISVCACATAMAVTARFAEAFVPALGGRAGLIRVDSLRTETSPVSASRYHTINKSKLASRKRMLPPP